MKILVFSDSHSSLRFMRCCVRSVKPDCLIHLGDHSEDGAVISAENPGIMYYSVPGNCDSFYYSSAEEAARIVDIAGVRFLITHGHGFHLKSGIGSLFSYGMSLGVQGILYGHTHTAMLEWEPGGLLVLNPGAAGSGGGSGAIIEISDGMINACRFVGQADLDSFV